MSDPYYTDDRVRIYHGDMMEVVPQLDTEFTACVTDPPYGIDFMSRPWDHGVPGVSAWETVSKALLPGAPLLAFGGTRKWHRLAVAIEDAGFELRDTVMYMYGAGFPKSHDISKAIDNEQDANREQVGTKTLQGTAAKPPSEGEQGHSGKKPGGGASGYEKEVPITAPATPEAQTWNGWGTALKPSWEPVLLAMNPKGGTFAENALEHGVAGLNIDGCRIETDEDTSRRTGTGEWSGSDEDNRNFTYTEDKVRGGHPGGRWPANLVLDEQAAEMVDGQSKERGIHSAGHAREHYTESSPGVNTNFGGGSPNGGRYGDEGGASRFFYTAKATRADRNSGFADVDNDHPTVKPSDLMKWLCRLVKMPERNHILDPFGGSGTTAYAAKELGMGCTIIEQEEEYCEIAAKRLRQQTLF